MLIRFFRSSFLLHYFAFVLIGALLWMNAFISPPPVTPPSPEYMPLYQVLYGLTRSIPLAATLIAFVIVILEGIMLNMILSEHDVVPRNTFLPGIFYLVFMSANPAGLTLYPALAATILFLPLLHILFGLYLQEDTLKEYLSAGMLAGISMMIYMQSLILLPIVLISLVIYRISDWRSWTSALAGFVIPFLYLLTYYFWTDSLSEAIIEWGRYFSGLFTFHPGGDLFNMFIFGGIFLLFILPAVFRTILRMNTHRISLRRLLSLTIWTLILTIAVFFTKGDHYLHTFMWLPAVIIITQNIAWMKKYFLQEILFLLLILSVAYHNFVH